MSNTVNSFEILVTHLSDLHNYFDGLKLFSNLYLANFLDTSTKSSFLICYRKFLSNFFLIILIYFELII